ncbi:MAG: 1-acyl-sn-glycerol-3-phosphate acyltransferase [Alphaproteobacteria bacterium]|nr:1-acyl-sn-glycerol-3-phosphate acyltransferase [Alphaproteobacteria bacterium]
MLRTFFVNFFAYIWAVLVTPLILVGLLSRKLLRRVAKIVVFGVLFIARWVGGIKIEIHNARYAFVAIASKHPIVASKHMSILETGILLAFVPNSFFIIKRELMWIPIYGWAFWRLGMVPVDRRAGATNMNALAANVRRKIESGGTLVMFPEGTRVKPGAGVKIRGGIMHIARALQLPILPVGLDTGLYCPKHGKIRPGTANVWFEQILPHDATAEEIAAAIGKHSA